MSGAGDGLRVVGGPHGAAAHLAEVEATAAALARGAGDCVALVARTATAVADSTTEGAVLLARAAVGTRGPAAVDAAAGLAELRAAAVGAGAVGALARAAARLAAVGASVAQAAALYRAREAALAGAAASVPLTAGTALRAGLVHLAVAPGGRLLLAVGALHGTALLVGGRSAGLLPAAGGLATRAEVVDAVVRVAPGVVGTPDVPSLARAVTALGRGSGLVVDDGVGVRSLPGAACGPAASATRPAGGVADLLGRSQQVAAWREPPPGHHDTLPPGAARPGKGEVRVDRVVGPDGATAWVVHVPGTQEWDTDGVGSPMDMAANLALVGGHGTAVTDGVTRAVRRAGVRPGEPVLLVGHSQGGLTAAHLAGDPAFRRHATVTHVVTAGSPVAGRPVPAGVRVLALEHTDDLVPRLDGRHRAGHPDRVDRTTVTTGAPDGPWRTDAVPAHSSSAYVETARAVDRSAEPSLVAYRESLHPFVDREGATCSSQRFRLERVGDGRGAP